MTTTAPDVDETAPHIILDKAAFPADGGEPTMPPAQPASDDEHDQDQEQLQQQNGHATDDPLTISLVLLSSAAQAVLSKKSGGSLHDKISLGHAMATHALACEMRVQNMLISQQPPAQPASGLLVPGR